MRNTPFLIVAVLVAAMPALAEDRMATHSHRHGVGELNIALDGDRLMIGLVSPAADLVGFEHAPETDAQRDRVSAMRAQLNAPADLFGIAARAGCRVHATEADYGGLAAVDGDHDDAHEDHGDHAHDDHAHDEKHHGEDDHAGASVAHTDVRVNWSFVCDDIRQVRGIALEGYFTAFPGTETLETSVISAEGIAGTTVSREAPRLDIVGLM